MESTVSGLLDLAWLSSPSKPNMISSAIWLLYCDPIYQSLRSGRIWHKVNF